MKKIILVLASLLLISSLPTTSFAHSARQAHSFRFSHQPHHFHHYQQRGSVGFYYGPSWHYPLYGSVPYVVQQPVAPTIYIERNSVPGESGTTTSQQDEYWFFCAASNTYYPYVRECAEPWQKVPQTPPQ